MLRNIIFAAALFVCLYTLAQAGDALTNKITNPVINERCFTKHPLKIEEKQCTKIPSTSSVYVLYCNQKTVSVCNVDTVDAHQ